MKATRFVFPSVAVFSMRRVFARASPMCVVLKTKTPAEAGVFVFVAPNAVAKGILQNYSRYAS